MGTRKPTKPKDVLGRRILVYWQLDDAWYKGTVERYSKRNKHPYYVKYDDGDEEHGDFGDFSKPIFKVKDDHHEYKFISDEESQSRTSTDEQQEGGRLPSCQTVASTNGRHDVSGVASVPEARKRKAVPSDDHSSRKKRNVDNGTNSVSKELSQCDRQTDSGLRTLRKRPSPETDKGSLARASDGCKTRSSDPPVALEELARQLTDSLPLPEESRERQVNQQGVGAKIASSMPEHAGKGHAALANAKSAKLASAVQDSEEQSPTTSPPVSAQPSDIKESKRARVVEKLQDHRAPADELEGARTQDHLSSLTNAINLSPGSKQEKLKEWLKENPSLCSQLLHRVQSTGSGDASAPPALLKPVPELVGTETNKPLASIGVTHSCQVRSLPTGLNDLRSNYPTENTVGSQKNESETSLVPKPTPVAAATTSIALPAFVLNLSATVQPEGSIDTAATEDVSEADRRVNAELKEELVGFLQKLNRTKDNIRAVTDFAIKNAGQGRARQVVQTIVEHLAAEKVATKRIDILYLLDSILNQSLREGKRVDCGPNSVAGQAYRKLISAGLSRVVALVQEVPDGASKVQKVLKLWSARKVLPDKLLEPYLDQAEENGAADGTGQRDKFNGCGPVEQAVRRRSTRIVRVPITAIGRDTVLVTLRNQYGTGSDPRHLFSSIPWLWVGFREEYEDPDVWQTPDPAPNSDSMPEPARAVDFSEAAHSPWHDSKPCGSSPQDVADKSGPPPLQYAGQHPSSTQTLGSPLEGEPILQDREPELADDKVMTNQWLSAPDQHHPPGLSPSSTAPASEHNLQSPEDLSTALAEQVKPSLRGNDECAEQPSFSFPTALESTTSKSTSSVPVLWRICPDTSQAAAGAFAQPATHGSSVSGTQQISGGPPGGPVSSSSPLISPLQGGQAHVPHHPSSPLHESGPSQSSGRVTVMQPISSSLPFEAQPSGSDSYEGTHAKPAPSLPRAPSANPDFNFPLTTLPSLDPTGVPSMVADCHPSSHPLHPPAPPLTLQRPPATFFPVPASVPSSHAPSIPAAVPAPLVSTPMSNWTQPAHNSAASDTGFTFTQAGYPPDCDAMLPDQGNVHPLYRTPQTHPTRRPLSSAAPQARSAPTVRPDGNVMQRPVMPKFLLRSVMPGIRPVATHAAHCAPMPMPTPAAHCAPMPMPTPATHGAPMSMPTPASHCAPMQITVPCPPAEPLETSSAADRLQAIKAPMQPRFPSQHDIPFQEHERQQSGKACQEHGMAFQESRGAHASAQPDMAVDMPQQHPDVLINVHRMPAQQQHAEQSRGGQQGALAEWAHALQAQQTTTEQFRDSQQGAGSEWAHAFQAQQPTAEHARDSQQSTATKWAHALQAQQTITEQSRDSQQGAGSEWAHAFPAQQPTAEHARDSQQNAATKWAHALQAQQPTAEHARDSQQGAGSEWAHVQSLSSRHSRPRQAGDIQASAWHSQRHLQGPLSLANGTITAITTAAYAAADGQGIVQVSSGPLATAVEGANDAWPSQQPAQGFQPASSLALPAQDAGVPSAIGLRAPQCMQASPPCGVRASTVQAGIPWPDQQHTQERHTSATPAATVQDAGADHHGRWRVDEPAGPSGYAPVALVPSDSWQVDRPGAAGEPGYTVATPSEVDVAMEEAEEEEEDTQPPLPPSDDDTLPPLPSEEPPPLPPMEEALEMLGDTLEEGGTPQRAQISWIEWQRQPGSAMQ